jgi:hypothetical protein
MLELEEDSRTGPSYGVYPPMRVCFTGCSRIDMSDSQAASVFDCIRRKVLGLVARLYACEAALALEPGLVYEGFQGYAEDGGDRESFVVFDAYESFDDAVAVIMSEHSVYLPFEL